MSSEQRQDGRPTTSETHYSHPLEATVKDLSRKLEEAIAGLHEMRSRVDILSTPGSTPFPNSGRAQPSHQAHDNVHHRSRAPTPPQQDHVRENANRASDAWDSEHEEDEDSHCVF